MVVTSTVCVKRQWLSNLIFLHHTEKNNRSNRIAQTSEWFVGECQYFFTYFDVGHKHAWQQLLLPQSFFLEA